jgi:hypothetical protein
MVSPHLADTSLRVDFRKPNWLALANAVPPAEPTYKAATRHGNLHSETVRRTAGLSAAKGLASLQVTLKRHNNVALPKTRAQLCMLPVLIGLDDKRDSLPLAEPADSHITQSEQATCKKCEYNKGDAFDGKEGKQVYHCLACNTWVHEACMSRREWETIILHDHLEQGRQQEMFSPEDLGQERSDKIRRYHEEMETEEGATSLPPWRCAGCTDKRQFAMTRILELSRTPTGKLMAVVEYMGYPRGELLDMEELIDPANALTDAFQAVQTLEADAHRTVHYVITEIKRGETTVPSLMHQGNHTSVISIDALQRRGYCRDSCTIFRLTPNVPFFLPLAVADLMTDCEGKSLGLIPAEATSTTTTRRRASLKRIIGHLTTVTDGALSFPAALADGTWGDGAWRGLELIAGARYSDLKQALEDFNTVYGPQQWRELLQRDVPGLTATDVEWLSTIKEEVRPKKKTKTPGARVECRKRKGDRGTHRDAPGKQRRGESGILTPTRETPGRAASVSPGETSGAMDLDDNPLTSDRGRRTEGHEGGGGDRDSAEEDSEEEETPAPSELARSLGNERPALQRIRLRLHGHDNAQGIAHKLQAFLMWVSLKVAHMDVADPVVFLSNVGEGEGEGGHRANRKAKRAALTSFQTPRFHQGTLNFGEERREPEGASEGGEEEGEGEQRGRARPRTNLGIGEGVAGSDGGRGSKRKSELSSSQAFSWR